MPPTEQPQVTVPRFQFPKRRPKVVLTVQQQLERQQRRARHLTTALIVLSIGLGVVLLGGVGVWTITSFSPPKPSTTVSPDAIRLLTSSVRLATLGAALMLTLAQLLRVLVRDRRRGAFPVWLILNLLLLCALPLGTLYAVLLLCLAPPRRWLDRRARRNQRSVPQA